MNLLIAAGTAKHIRPATGRRWFWIAGCCLIGENSNSGLSKPLRWSNGLSHLSRASLAGANFLQVAQEKKSVTRWAAFSIMQYGGSSLTAIQSQVLARVLVFVFLQSVSEPLTFSKLKRCICCWGYWGFGKRRWCFSTCRRDYAGANWPG